MKPVSDYQIGEGWYMFRVWVNTDGEYTVNDWQSPEKPEPVWVENKCDYEQMCEVAEGCECITEYLGYDEKPDESMFTIKIIYNDIISEGIETFNNINDYKEALAYYGIKTEANSVTVVWQRS